MIQCWVKWYCKVLEKEITVDTKAVPNVVCGEGLWLCDCTVKDGRHKRPRWTTGNDNEHDGIMLGFRDYPN